MEIKLQNDSKYLSSDLTGYEKYLEKQGYTYRHIGFLKLAPKLLFRLFGHFGAFELMNLVNYRKIFIKRINRNYKEGTLKKYRSGITHFKNYLISVGVLNPELHTSVSFKNCDPVRIHYLGARTDYLRNVERKFFAYLQQEIMCSDSEIRKRIVVFQRLSSYLIVSDYKTFSKLSAGDVLNFCGLKTTTKTDLKQLPCFLQYAFREGLVSKDFSKLVVRKKKNVGRKKRQYLKQDQIEQLLSCLPRVTVKDKRSYAMFLLMARLGLRPIELTRIKLKDIQWTRSRILIHGKNDQDDWMPIFADVASAIIEYLKVSRRGLSDYLFIQLRPSHKKLNALDFLRRDLAKAYEITRIKPPTGNARLNVFRHSFATNNLNNPNLTLKCVQGLLRHQSDQMTAHYAKYHINKPSIFNHDWPGAVK